MKHALRNALAALLLAPAAAMAQIDFSSSSVSEVLTVAEIQAALGVSTTAAIDGIALGSGNTVYIAHRDNAGLETFAAIDYVTKTASWTKTVASIQTDLGAPFNATAGFPILVSEFDVDAANGYLYFADASRDANDEYSLLRLDLDSPTRAASAVLRSSTIYGINSHGILPNGNVVVDLGEDFAAFASAEPNVGFVDPTAGSPAYTEVYDEDEFKAAVIPPLGVAEECPPETIGINPSNGDTYVFGHDTFHLFRVDDIDGATPTLTWLDIPGWTGVVDLHGLDVDTQGNLYGFDEGGETITVWDGTTVNAITLDDIATDLRGPTPPVFGPTLWRGMKARDTGATTAEVFLASSTGDYGVVRISFGGASSVSNWEQY